jgi:transcriptional regulator with XRE-family HTH domain
MQGHGGHPPRRTLPPDVGEALREARLAHGWSLRRAARESGVSRSMIEHLEKARRAPSTVTALAIIAAYGLEGTAAAGLWEHAVDGKGRDWRPAW